MMKTIHFTILILLTVLLASCTTPVSSPLNPDTIGQPDQLTVDSSLPGINTHQTLWGIWDGKISADRSSVELIPLRNASFRLNVVGFLEQTPCQDCLQLISKQIIGINRLNVSLQLSHPFSNHPEYTGFDVFGGIMFPPTTLIIKPELHFKSMISWRYDGGCQLLNPDGYDLRFMFLPPYPDVENKWRFFIPGALGGEIVWDLSEGERMVWPYRLFRTSETRNMFEVNGTDIQTYELWLPAGEEVKFGYVVVAHWAPAEVNPVTNPSEDFPRDANRAGPYRFEVLDISGPVSTSQDAVIHFLIHWFPVKPSSHIDFPYQSEYDYLEITMKDIELVSSENGVNEYYMTVGRDPDGPFFGTPGIYPFVLIARACQVNCKHINPDCTYYIFEVETLD